jgi:hypothetical protein
MMGWGYFCRCERLYVSIGFLPFSQQPNTARVEPICFSFVLFFLISFVLEKPIFCLAYCSSLRHDLF